MYLHQSDICRYGSIENCSKGGSPKQGQFGGWKCSGGCMFDTFEQKKLYHSGDTEAVKIVQDRLNEKMKKMRLQLKENLKIL